MAMLLLASKVYPEFCVPLWVIVVCASSITAGTLFGGWNIIKTVGYGIYKVRLIHSIVDQIGSALIIISSSVIGAPTSTTQVVTTTLMGVGAGERPHHVRWMEAKSIAAGWLLNIPACMLFGAFYCFIFLKILS
ncbi:Phosphate transporter family protein [Solitalea koreensis]|uniref:Phosphate transporter family protein n=1 Tax=Solitalea koreensis TaxID=543615 RepID=A0A521C2F9_9SPHI|nr:Phosphate transporter family protein [Solitalea koreensis]